MSSIAVLDENEQHLLNVLPRVAASISICCSSCIIYTVLSSEFYRRRIYHRIMMGCSVNIILLNIVQIWGPAAVPKDTPGVCGAQGTIMTCSMQGFLYQLLMFVVPFYYVALSFLSLAAIVSKFETQRYRWIEKWIHIAVHVFPLASATYLLTIDAYNPAVRDCYVTSLPMGCGDGSDVPCIRGPQNIYQVQKYFLAAPFLFVIMFPAAIMSALYVHVRFRQGPTGRVVANSVAKQSCLYLLALYWTYSFRIVDAAMINALDKYVFISNLLANTVEAFQGLWMLMVYWYFRSEDPTQVEPFNPDSSDGNTGSGRHRCDKTRRGTSSVNTFKTSMVSFNAPSDVDLEVPSNPNTGRRHRRNIISSRNRAGRRVSGTRSDTSSGYLTRPEFSIFDGSKNYDASESPWSAFLTDEFEDSGYHENCEYDDTEFFGMSEGQKSTKTSTKKPTNHRSEDHRDAENDIPSTPSSSSSSSVSES